MNQGIVRLQLITHNARLVDARKQMEFTAPEFAATIGISTGRLRLIETLKRVPLEDEICRMACVLEKMPEYLFPDRLLLAVQEGIFAKRHAELEMPHLEHLIEIKQSMLLTAGGLDEVADEVDTQLLGERINEVFAQLTPRERFVLDRRFGLNGQERAHTLEEIGTELGVIRERVRQIEGKALRKLRHPCRSRVLKDFLE